MVAASKTPAREIAELISKINGNKKNSLEKEAQLSTRRAGDKIEITPTCVYTLLHKGELMATIHTGSKIAVFYHRQHYFYRRDFEARLKPLVDYLFNNKYTLMSQKEYEERFAPAPKNPAKNANN